MKYFSASLFTEYNGISHFKQTKTLTQYNLYIVVQPLISNI